MEDPFYNGLRQVEIMLIPIQQECTTGERVEYEPATQRDMSLYAYNLISREILDKGRVSCKGFMVAGRNYRWGFE